MQVRLRELIFEKAAEHSWQVFNLTVKENGVEFVISVTPDTPPVRIASQMRSYTSKNLKNEFIALKKLATLWSSEYFVCTIGEVSKEKHDEYEKSQKGK
jgi:putative transposase